VSVTSVVKDVDTLTLVADFDATAERVWRLRADLSGGPPEPKGDKR
jgi:hypothetical protein